MLTIGLKAPYLIIMFDITQTLLQICGINNISLILVHKAEM